MATHVSCGWKLQLCHPRGHPVLSGPGGRGLRQGTHSPDQGGVVQIGNNNVEGGSPALPLAWPQRPRAGRGGGASSPGRNRARREGGDPGWRSLPPLLLLLVFGASGGTVRKLDLEVIMFKSSHFGDKETEVKRRNRTCERSLSIPVAPCPVGRSIYSLTPRATLLKAVLEQGPQLEKSPGGISSCSHGKGSGQLTNCDWAHQNLYPKPYCSTLVEASETPLVQLEVTGIRQVEGVLGAPCSMSSSAVTMPAAWDHSVLTPDSFIAK